LYKQYDVFCSFYDPFFQLDQTCATPSDRSGPPAAGRPRHSACQSGLGENLDFRLFSACFIAARLCLPTLLVQTTTVAKKTGAFVHSSKQASRKLFAGSSE